MQTDGKTASEAYRFMLGDFPCWSVDDGGHTYSVESLFANVPREEAEQALRGSGSRPTASRRPTPTWSSTPATTGCSPTWGPARSLIPRAGSRAT